MARQPSPPWRQLPISQHRLRRYSGIPMTDAFGNFIDAVESVIRRLQEPKDIVLAIEPYLWRAGTGGGLIAQWLLGLHDACGLIPERLLPSMQGAFHDTL